MSTVSAIDYTWTPTEFLDNISNINDGDTVTISNGTANVSTSYTINQSNIVIQVGTGATVTFRGNTAIDDAFLNIKGINVTLKGINFKNIDSNKALVGGGAIYIDYGGSAIITNCTFTENVANYGGAIAINVGGSATITNCTLEGNNASFYGGAIYFEGSNVIISNCIFMLNHADEDYGGAIHLARSSATITNCTFTENVACRGGALFISENCNVIITNCTFSLNKANNENGGAISTSDHTSDNANIIITNSTFKQNKAKGNGGALYIREINATLINCTFRQNKAEGSGGAIELYYSNVTIINSTIEWNNATKYGGAIDVDEGGSVAIANCTFRQNKADKKSGGAIDVYDGSATIANCTFSLNKANEGNGGALYIYKDGSVNIANCTLTENLAYKGGALYIDRGSSTLTNCILKWNNATNYGGAIYIYKDYSATITNSTLQWNNARNGGAIQIDYGSAIITNCTLTQNKATHYGGAIDIDKGGSATITNSTLQWNNATWGGAIDVYDGSATITKSILTQNHANSDGGALYIYTDGSANINNSAIHDNSGYDIYNTATLTVYGGKGGIIYNAGTLNGDHLTAIILGNETVSVAKDNVFGLYAFIKLGNYTVIGSTFNFIIRGAEIPSNLTGDHYTADYHVTGNVGDEILVSGSYIYGVVNYETAILLVKNSVSLNGTNMTLPYGKKIEVKLNATILNGDNVTNGTVSISINGETYTSTVYNGVATVEIADKLDTGVYYLTAVYIENDDYLNTTFDFILNITKANSTVGISVDNVNYGEQVIVKIVTVPEMTGNLALVVNGNSYSVSTDSKQYIISDVLDAGIYSVYAYYVGDRNFKFSDNLTEFSVKPIATYTNVTVENISGGAILYIDTTDIKSNPAEGYVTVLVNGSHIYSTVVRNGTGKVIIADLPTGHYSAVVTFNSTGNYGVSCDNCSFNITSAPSGFDLIGYNVYKEFENDTQYHAKVTDSLGNPLEGMRVLVSISNSQWTKDANYTIVTGKDGIATLMINLLPNDYKITAYFADKVAVNNITVIATNFNLKADSFTKYFMNGTQYTVKVTDVNNNPVANRTVTIAIYKSTWKNPAKYYAKTNADGIATLDINLIAGTYSVTSSICYNSTKSSIVVLPTLTAESITKKINKEANLKAKLVDGQGNPSKNKEIQFTVKEKVYTFTTNSVGIATLPIHLGVGTWSILISDVESGAKTRVTVKVIR